MIKEKARIDGLNMEKNVEQSKYEERQLTQKA